MLKVGDKVWYKCSRDKERGAVITNVYPHSILSDYEIKIDSGPHIHVFEKEIRSMAIDHTIAKKNDQEKNRLELIPVSGIEGIGRAMTFGAKKYSAHNWANGFEWLRLAGSALRHLTAWMAGQDKDPESGLSHLDHLGACVVMLIAHETEGLGVDNRRKRKQIS